MGETNTMIKLKDILTERISDVVYHFTKTEAADNIIATNRFRLSHLVQDTPRARVFDPGKKYEEGYYMSVSRTKIEGYTLNTPPSSCHYARFELDGTKLGNKYKGGAYNYWDKMAQHSNDYEEYEDRVYSTDMYITNALSYIKRLDVDVSRKCSTFDTGKLIRTATRANVPTFLYPSREKWAQQSGGIEVKDMDGYKLFMQSIVK